MIAAGLRDEIQADIAELSRRGTVPKLAIVVPTQDDATAWYVRSLVNTAKRVGAECLVDELIEPTAADLCRRLDELSTDPGVHGIICQTPLPKGLALTDVAGHITTEKDVDGANPTSLGRLAAGLPSFAPATAAAVLEILKRSKIKLAGAEAVVVGRSNVVGKPVALLLSAEDATVTLCHSRTRDLAVVCARADVLVVAVGRPKTVGAAHIQAGAVVIDVGTNPTPDGGLIGDVAADELAAIDGLVSPVPGGVGPVTTALLLRNTVRAATTASR
jgi:methylenetetrahydrofolate dehydrogenase (NADP+)/methenyltetrahydrofolate cyclohydrolase